MIHCMDVTHRGRVKVLHFPSPRSSADCPCTVSSRCSHYRPCPVREHLNVFKREMFEIQTVAVESNRCWPRGTTITHVVFVSTVLIQASRVTLVAIHENRHFIHASNRITLRLEMPVAIWVVSLQEVIIVAAARPNITWRLLSSVWIDRIDPLGRLRVLNVTSII